MTENAGDSGIPGDWDRIRDAAEEPGPEAFEPEAFEPGLEGDQQIPVSVLVGSALGDLVAVLGVCALALAVLALLGYRAQLAMLPWTVALAVAWWIAAAAATVLIRQATPGMLMAGVAFESTVSRARIPSVLLTALVLCCSLGIPALLGARHSPLRLAAGVDLVAVSRRPANEV
jgi:hypothetical protein